MEKIVSDELYVRFKKNRSEIYSEYPLSDSKSSPTEESFIRDNLDVIKKRSEAFRELMPEIVKFEKKDAITRRTVLIIIAITGLASWGANTLLQNMDLFAPPGLVIAFMGACLVIGLAWDEKPFSFMHRKKEPRLFRLNHSLISDTRAVFRKKSTLKSSNTQD